MTPNDLVYMEVYKACLKQGCSEMISKNAAVDALQKYKNNQFTKVTKLISQSITDAKKFVVKKRK